MKRAAFPIRFVVLVGMVVLLALLVTHPVGALPFLFQDTPEPTPRPTATPAPFIELSPSQGVAGDATTVMATGGLWLAGGTVSLFWDTPGLRLGTAEVAGDGAFRLDFVTPTGVDVAGLGPHTVIAVQGDLRAETTFELIEGTPTPTPTVTNTPEPPTPTFTASPVTPSATPTTTPTSIPTPTLRPVTPMVTISPMPSPTQRPATRVPATRVPAATRTNTPVPGTPTNTRTPSATPLPSPTPGPGTPSATPLPTALATPTPVGEISDTGSGVGTIFLWGFVLGGLLLVFRFLRVRSLTG